MLLARSENNTLPLLMVCRMREITAVGMSVDGGESSVAGKHSANVSTDRAEWISSRKIARQPLNSPRFEEYDSVVDLFDSRIAGGNLHRSVFVGGYGYESAESDGSAAHWGR